MQKNWFRKGLVIGIIVLFVGVSISSSIAGYDKDIEKIDYIINKTETLNMESDDYNNLIKQAIESGVISKNNWLEQDKLLASDGTAEDYFGYVSIDGDYAIVGAPWDDDNGNESGSAYVFKRSGTAWTEQAKLFASDGAKWQCFGYHVSISGDYSVVGAYGDFDNGFFSGSAYVFKRSGTAWTEQAKLLASDGAIEDCFGGSVSIDGDYVIVGASYDDDNGNMSGSAYVFKRSGTAWTEQAKLLPSDGAAGDWFGGSVSIDGDYVIVGASYDDDNGNMSGSAYVFKRSGTAWTEQAKLLPSDGAAGDWFGGSVSIDGDYVIVGASYDDDNGNMSGSAYVFKRSGTAWTQQAKLLPSDGAAEEHFGISVSISGDYAIVGAIWNDDNGNASGSAYVFKKDNGGNQPILSNEHPVNISLEVERPPTELSATVEDPDGDVMDVHIRWKVICECCINNPDCCYNYNDSWIIVKTFNGVGNGTYNFIINESTAWLNDWIWGNTTYVWSINVTDGTTWTNETYQYTTSGSRYDVSNNDLVNFQDAGLVWIHRTSEVDYDGIYDVNQNGEVNFQDAGLTWVNRD